MKVGILTYHHTTNYGATMQTLGVVGAVRSLGHEPVVLDWRPVSAISYYRRRLYRSKAAPQNILQHLRMKSFVDKNMPCSPRVKSPDELNTLCKKLSLDAVVVGSDQVWQLNSKSIRGWAPEYLLDFVPDGVRRVAYAPSAGAMTDFEEHSESAAQLLMRFDSLSARDLNTRDLVSRVTGRSDVAYVLDPTLIADLSHLAKKPPISDPYLLVYAELPTRHTSMVRSIASRLGLRIVSIAYRYPGESNSEIAVSPEKWLGYFANAKFIVTSFFHGTIFSIINRVPFYTMRQGHRSIKVMDLLSRLGLEDRALDISETHNPSVESLGLDYSNTEEKINAARAQSIAYLEGALQ